MTEAPTLAPRKSKVATRFAYSLIVPTYRRPDVLRVCLERIAALDFPPDTIEVRVYDNGAPADSRAIVEAFHGRIANLTYTLNESGHGLGYSLCRGAEECTGDRVVEMNDDALIGSDFLTRLDAVFGADDRIGVVGVRAIEEQYFNLPGGIGTIDARTGDVVGNFNRPTDGVIDVDHVYGFCYAYTRAVMDAGGRHDRTLLAKDYSSGNRIETDQCLTAKRLGFRVVYDGTHAVTHLAKPRADMSERSAKWKVNHTRNTLYLFLKHYGPFGRRALALRSCFLHDVGIVSLLKRPTKANAAYFATGLRARASAVWHWLRHVSKMH
jgi:GT2 family glycosyltransferase